MPTKDTPESEIICIPGGNRWRIHSDIVDRLSRPSTTKGRLQRAALALLHDWNAAGEIPASIRFAFYALETRGVVSKVVLERPAGVKGRRADQDLQDAFTWLRDKDVVPWSWIKDDRRSISRVTSSATVVDDVAGLLDYARINPWQHVPQPVILCESLAVAGVLAGLAARYVVPISGLSGWTNGFLRTEVAPLLAERATRVLYIGDADVSGYQIETGTREILEDELGIDLCWERLALTEQQLDDFNLRRLTIMKYDARTKKTNPAVEAEALGQTTIRALVSERLDALLPEPLDDVLEREARERQRIRDVLASR